MLDGYGRVTRRPQRDGERDDSYDTAQVCPNGHLITEFAVTRPNAQKEICPQCGEKTVMTCEHCSAPIQGYRYTRTPYLSHYQPPRFCHNCGGMFPWTRVYLEEARELVEELELSEQEKSEMKQSIEHLAKNIQTEVAQTKMKRLLRKGGEELSGVFFSILTNVASAEVIKFLVPK